MWQWQDRAFQADANGSEGTRGSSRSRPPTTPPPRRGHRALDDAAGRALVDLIVWECSLKAHADCPEDWDCHRGVDWRGVRVAIPPVLVPDTKPSRRGLAVHRQGVMHSQRLRRPGLPRRGRRAVVQRARQGMPGRRPGRAVPRGRHPRGAAAAAEGCSRRGSWRTRTWSAADAVRLGAEQLRSSSASRRGGSDHARRESIALRIAAALRRNECAPAPAHRATQRDFGNRLKALHPQP